MQRIKKKSFARHIILAAVFVAAMFIYGGTLLNMQIANADRFQVSASEIARTERFIVSAARGEIFDRHGTPLVTNRLVRELTIDGAKFPRGRNAQLADTEHIINLVRLVRLYGGELLPSALPIISRESEGGEHLGYTYCPSKSESPALRDSFFRFLRANGIPLHISPGELVNRLSARYGLDELMPPEGRDHELFMAVLGVSYDLDRRRVIAHQTRHKLASDLCDILVKALRESSHNHPGVEILTGYARVHHVPHSAPHLIGRIGRIPAGQLDRFTALGYPMDAIVGLNGVEAAFEHFLRGWDGVLFRHYDADGNIIGEEFTDPRTGEDTSPVPGKNVYLTIDIRLQQVAEHSLPRTISRIHELAEGRAHISDFEGWDARAGAAVVKDPHTGEILALATYPSYNLATFNEDFAELNACELSPMLNRALQGLYAPGSVFKVATSLAALSSGNLAADELIYTRGTYTRYETFRPRCWAAAPGGRWCHHAINVSQALAVSCNYFYFVVGGRMAADGDIELLNSYARRMGLGVRTGIEIGEAQGINAGRAHRQAGHGQWFGGDTLVASIGQSDYLFTPIQMAAMTSTVLTGGTRYATRLLLRVKKHGSGEIYYAPRPVVAERIDIEPAHLHALKAGMGDTFDAGGTGEILFRDLHQRGLTTGGKTGTAEIGGRGSSHATIVAFAPYEEPEIAMSVVIEHGRMGTWAGFTVESVFAYYFGHKSFEESLGIAGEEPELEYGAEQVAVSNS